MASTYLTRTPGSASNRQTWTWSAWIKLGALGTDRNLFGAYAHSADNLKINIADTDQVSIRFYNNTEYQLGLNRKFRDTSAWYHLVFAVDTTLASGGDRFKIYVNGVRETSFAAANDPTQNLQMTINEATATQIGRFNTGSYFDGSMANVEFVDGTALGPEYFGSTNTASGIWTPQASSTISSYGTNGFKLKMDTATPGADTSGNTNNFTVGGGTPTLTQGSPSNVYATLNSLNSWGDTVLTNVNTTAGNTGTSAGHVSSTIHMNSGKWYMEFNVDTHLTGYSAPMFLLAGTGVFQQAQVGFNASGDGSYGIGSNGRKITDGVSSSSVVFTELVNGDKVQIAFDADAGKAWFGINDVYLGSGNPSTGANPYFTTTKLQNNDVSLIILGYNGNAMSTNFGNGYFGTTAVTTNSGNGYAGAEGASKFNYTVPTGYSALNTKGLNE
jgi:hypothetical protein